MHDILMSMAIMLTASCAFLLFAALESLGHLKEPHHGYYGLVGCLLALLAIQLSDYDLLWWAIYLACSYALVDDTIQHTWQVWGHPNYASPLHRWYASLYERYAWVRRLDVWANNLIKSL